MSPHSLIQLARVIPARRVQLALALIPILFCSCRDSRTKPKPVLVFAAASLNTALVDFEKGFERENPDIDVQVEVSGSLVAARKIREYKRQGDIVISADKRVIDNLLIPEFTDWQIAFLSNEIVLAYSEKSRHGAEVQADTWPGILLDPAVQVARVDENLGPLGYQTLLVWKLADRYYKEQLRGNSLFESLSKRVTPRFIRPDAAELLPTLGTEADYLFVYRSMARDHNLKHILLPAEVNLSSSDHSDLYSAVSVTISAAPDRPLTIQGEPILFSLTIVRDAPNRAGAVCFVQALLSASGKAVFERHGFTVLSPPMCLGSRDSVPQAIRATLPPPEGTPETAK